MLRWHSSNAFTLACSCFIFFPPPTTGLLPSIKMNPIYFLSHPFSLRKKKRKKSDENIYGYVMTHLVFAPKKFSHHRPKFWIDKVRTSYTKIILFFARLSFLQEHFSLQFEYEFAEYKQGKGAMLTEAAETMWICDLPINMGSSPSKQKFITFPWAFLRSQLITIIH